LTRSVWPLAGIAALAVAIGALAFAVQSGRSALGPVGVALGTWVIAGSALDLWSRTGRTGRFGRLLRLPRADWGKALAHGGMGITIIGIAAITAWGEEDIRAAQIGERWAIGAYELEMRGVTEGQGPNYLTTMAEIAIRRGDEVIAVVYPEKRFYPVAGAPTTEAGIDIGFWRDIYIVIGDEQDAGGWAVRSYVKPFANWIWGGAILMAIGGFVSLSDRRLRVAAGAARAPVAVAAE